MKSMQSLGFVSAILEELDFDGVIDFAKTHDYDCVEMMCWPGNSDDNRRYAGCSHIDVENMDVVAIKEKLTENEISISGLGYYPNPMDEDKGKSEYYIEHIKKVIRGCNQLDVPVMNTFIGRNKSLNMDENLELFKKLWKPIIETAEIEGIKIGIENCPMFFTNDEWPAGTNLAVSPAIWDRMFEIFPTSLFGLNYDPSHMVFQMMDEIQPLYEFRDRLHHVHLKDVNVDRERLDRVGILAKPSEFHTPKLPGLGQVRWPAFFKALKITNYAGSVVVEVEDRAYEGSLSDVSKALNFTRDYIRPLMN